MRKWIFGALLGLILGGASIGMGQTGSKFTLSSLLSQDHTWTGVQTFAGGSGGGAPLDATYLTQTTNSTLSAEQALASLSSGIMRVATTTGAVTSLTTSAGIAANISDETGSGVLVFGIAPSITNTSAAITADARALDVSETEALSLTQGAFGPISLIRQADGTNYAFGILNTTYSRNIEDAFLMYMANDGDVYVYGFLRFNNDINLTGNFSQNVTETANASTAVAIGGSITSTGDPTIGTMFGSYMTADPGSVNVSNVIGGSYGVSSSSANAAMELTGIVGDVTNTALADQIRGVTGNVASSASNHGMAGGTFTSTITSSAHIDSEGALGVNGTTFIRGTSDVDQSWGGYYTIHVYDTANTDTAAGIAIGIDREAGATVGDAYGIYITNLASDLVTTAGHTAYPFWYAGGGADCNVGGVYRINNFGIPAYYNPCFTAYTPGAANFERLINRWGDTGVYGADNRAYMGVEVGGTGTDRAVNLVGANYSITSTLTPGVTDTSANSCGTGTQTIVGNDNAGKVTVIGSAGTSCTVTFATAFTNAPSCSASNETTAALARATSTTTTVILAGVFAQNDVIAYVCLGR